MSGVLTCVKNNVSLIIIMIYFICTSLVIAGYGQLVTHEWYFLNVWINFQNIMVLDYRSALTAIGSISDVC